MEAIGRLYEINGLSVKDELRQLEFDVESRASDREELMSSMIQNREVDDTLGRKHGSVFAEDRFGILVLDLAQQVVN
jgi:hypothetical protein